MFEPNIRIYFSTFDQNLAGVLARALGDGFSTRTSSQFQMSGLEDLCEWCDVLLIDLRPSGTQDACETGLRFMGEMNQLEVHPPMVVLFDGDIPGLNLQVIERGAYDSITNPPNMVAWK